VPTACRADEDAVDGDLPHQGPRCRPRRARFAEHEPCQDCSAEEISPSVHGNGQAVFDEDLSGTSALEERVPFLLVR
jgi:hypothetical protein